MAQKLAPDEKKIAQIYLPLFASLIRTEMEIIICGDGSFDFPQDCPVGNAHLRTDL